MSNHPTTLETIFPTIKPEWSIQQVAKHLAGSWDITLADGTTTRVHELTPVGESRRGFFRVYRLGCKKVNTPAGRLNTIEISDIVAAVKVEVEADAVAARVAARMANRKRNF